MAELQLFLLGDLQIRRAGQQDITPNISTKAQALLCYLVETGHKHQRAILTGLFWGEKPEEDARRSLRVEFTKMRPYLDAHLEITRQTAVFLRDTPYWLDTEAFTHFLELSQTADGASERAYLREAVALYRGEFLAGFMVSDAPDFEEWVLARRERYRQGAIQALARLVEICLEQQDYVSGIEYAQRLLEIDAWREETHQQLMRLLSLNGQRTAALRQYEICRDVLAEELGIAPSAQTRALFEQIRQMESGQALSDKRPLPPPPTATPSAVVPFQPPDLVPHFLGRETELNNLAARLSDADAPAILALVGMGGLGKSSLAIHLAHRLREQFADGVLWADAALSEPTSIAARWAGAYGYDFNSLPTVAERFAALRRLLADKRILIVLDDVTVAARVKPLLPSDGRAAILITTRSADIADALDAEIVNLDVLSPGNGRSLLASFIGEERVQAESNAADQIVQRLQQLPLAMAIAGRYLAARPRRRLTDFAQQLSSETARLDLSAGDTAVRASFTISWQALDEDHQRIFAILAVFNGRHFTAEAIAYISDLDAYLVQDRLDRLVSLSLLNEHAERHYRQHALLADYAREKMGADVRPTHRLIDYFLQFSHQHHANYALLTPEWENLDTAVKIAYDFRRWVDVADFSHTLHTAWFARGRFDWARQAHEWAVTAAQMMSDLALEARALFRWGQAALEQADYEPATALFKRSLALFRQMNNLAGIADCQYELARIAINQSKPYAEVAHLLAESRQIREQLGHQADIAAVLFRQSRLALIYNQWEEACQLGLEALALQEAAGEKLAMTRTLHHLAWVHINVGGAADEAVAYAERNIQLAAEVDDVGELALAWYARGAAARVQGKLDEALDWVHKSYEPLLRMGDKRSVGLVLYQKMVIHRSASRYEEALALGQQCLVIFEELGDLRQVAWTIGNMGIIYYMQQRYAEARRFFTRACEMGVALQDEVWVKLMQERLAWLDGVESGQ